MIDPSISPATAKLIAELSEVTERAYSAGVDARDIFHAVARAFGTELSNAEPKAAANWMRREAGRIESLAHSQPGTGKDTVQ